MFRSFWEICAGYRALSGGIGAEIARVLHGAGATVALSGTREDPLKALAGELGERAHVVPCDLFGCRSRRRAAQTRRRGDGCARHSRQTMPGSRETTSSMRMSDAEWQSVLDVNLTATMRLCRGAVRGMMKARWGRIP